MKITHEYLQKLKDAWFEQSLAHLERCEDEHCEFSYRFSCFLLENGVSDELLEKWLRHLRLTPDHRDFGKPLPIEGASSAEQDAESNQSETSEGGMSYTLEEMQRINEYEMWGPEGRPKGPWF